MPGVSVLMVFYRVTPFLVPAVRSVLTQTFRDLELVLVDNGTGLGVEPLGEWGRDPRIQLVRWPTNGGIAAGHNAAMAQARGDYIALLDYDDIALPTRIERQLAVLRSDPRLGIVTSRVEAIDENGGVVGREFCLLGEREQYVFSGYTTPGVMPTCTGRREVFERCAYRGEFAFASDYDFIARALELRPSRGVPEILTHYRHHPRQATIANASSQRFHACAARLCTARRRAGRAEDVKGLVEELGPWRLELPPEEVFLEYFAERSLREGFASLAVYHARKLLAVRRNLPALRRAGRIMAGAMRLAPRQATLLLRLFFTGPLRAYGLKPA